MLDVLSTDYIRTARAKGVPRRTITWRHATRNALIPFVTVVALETGALFGGLIITEKIFSIPGMGQLFYDSLLVGDSNVVVAWMIITAIFIMLFNLIADLLYGFLDPRVLGIQAAADPGNAHAVPYLHAINGFTKAIRPCGQQPGLVTRFALAMRSLCLASSSGKP